MRDTESEGMAAAAAVPVFMRVGDGDEYELGSFTPDVKMAPLPQSLRISDAEFEVDAVAPLAEFLRRAADVIEKGTHGDLG
jgi:hypothetical protein